MTVKLGVNVDHVATLRQARGVNYPDPVQAALQAIDAGATGITIHLREDRRHIQDHDVTRMKQAISVPLNLEMAATEEMLAIAEAVQPQYCCLVPEKRAELTTEGGLDVIGQQAYLAKACEQLHAVGIKVSLFIDPDTKQIAAAKAVGADIIELHTGTYAEATDAAAQHAELVRLQEAGAYAQELGLVLNAGHGLTVANVAPIAAIPGMNELNIGHSIVADTIFFGIAGAVKQMLVAMAL